MFARDHEAIRRHSLLSLGVHPRSRAGLEKRIGRPGLVPGRSILFLCETSAPSAVSAVNLLSSSSSSLSPFEHEHDKKRRSFPGGIPARLRQNGIMKSRHRLRATGAHARPGRRVAVWFAIGWLAIGSAVGCRSTADDRTYVSPGASAPRILVLGGSVSSGAGTVFRLAEVLQAGVGHLSRVVDLSDQGLFLDPEMKGKRAMERVASASPSAVVALDFLFWFVHREESLEARSSALTDGLFLLESLDVPIFVGRLPAVTRSAAGDLPVHAQSLATEERDELNRRITDWAQKSGSRFVLPVDSWYAALRLSPHSTRGPQAMAARPERWIQADGLHTTEDGLQVIAIRCLERLGQDLAWLEAERVAAHLRALGSRLMQPVRVIGAPLDAAERPRLLKLIETRMVALPPGSFLMGSAEDGPAHRVALGAFMMSATEVTQGQWQAVMQGWKKAVTIPLGARGEASVEFLASNPSLNRSRLDLPVENVSWFECQEFIRRLNELAGLKGRDRYRLPTEAEWEYACRAGTDTPFSFGRDPRRLGDHAWYAGNARKTQPIGQLRPNGRGLYDMHGNVAEWCADFFGPYTDRPARDPEGPAAGEMRVVRGGSLAPSRPLGGVPHAWGCRASARQGMAPKASAGSVGFRLARTVR